MEEHPEVIVPVLPPERSLISASDIHSMRLFVERLSKHPVLSQDYELQIFIESEFGVTCFFFSTAMRFLKHELSFRVDLTSASIFYIRSMPI